MQTLTTFAKYNKEKRILFLEDDLPTYANQTYTVILKLIPWSQPSMSYQKKLENVLNSSYGLAGDLPAGVSYARSIRDQAEKRIKHLWS